MFNWNEQADATLKQRRAEKCTSVAIAIELGCSKNAVIGRAKRLGLERLKNPDNSTIGGAIRKRRRSAGIFQFRMRKQRSTPTEVTPMLVAPLYIPTIALENFHCRQPVNQEGEPYTFCGHQKAAGLPYCAYHARINFLPAPEPKPKAYFRLPGRAA